MTSNQTPAQIPDLAARYYLDIARLHVTLAALNHLQDTTQLNNLQSPNATLSLDKLHHSIRALETEALNIIVLTNLLTKED